MTLKFYGKRKPEKKSKDFIYEEWDNRYTSLRIWIEYKDIYLIHGYFMMNSGNKGPFEKLLCKNHGLNVFQLYEHQFGSPQELEDFKNFLAANKITFI